MRTSGIYLIQNLINNKGYIGSSLDIVRRKRNHLNDLVKNIHPNSHLQTSFNKYGIDKFRFIILEKIIATNKQELLPKEQEWILLKKTNQREYGYNKGLPLTSINGVEDNTNMKYTPLVVLDNNGKKINRYSTVQECCDKLNLDSRKVYEALVNKRKSVNNYILIKEEAYDENKDYKLVRAKYKTKGVTPRVYLSQQTDRTILKIDKETEEVVAKFSTPKLAAEDANTNVKYIYKVIQGEKNSYKGYIYKYETYKPTRSELQIV